MREPRGLRWVALWLGLLGAVVLGMSLLVVAAELVAEIEGVDVPLGATPLLVAAVLGFIGLLGLAAGYGIWKRRRWAWMMALVLSAFQVLQFLLALASGGFSGIVSYGVVSALVSLWLFWYLTRPYVARAFGRG